MEVMRENQTSESSDSPGHLDWWSGAVEEDAPMALDASEGGLWSGTFVPPPPRPIFLDEAITPDGLTTCDLCSWAWQGHKPFTVDAAREVPGELGWVLTLVIVSIISAAIGAVIMITALHCKSRMKNNGTDSIRAAGSNAESNRASIRRPADPNNKNLTINTNAADPPNGVWSWLISRRRCSDVAPVASPVTENHYTHMMDDNYASVGDEALYAELDRESTNSPAYQNSAYTDPDAPVSSAPSSAYYSDLSMTDRAYEVVGGTNGPPPPLQLTMQPMSQMQCWDGDIALRKQAPIRLAAISETVTMPSDYV